MVKTELTEKERMEHQIALFQSFKRPSTKSELISLKEDISKVFNLEISQEKLQKNSIEVFREINNLKMIFNSQKYHIREHDLMIVNNDKKPVPTINNQINDFKKTLSKVIDY